MNSRAPKNRKTPKAGRELAFAENNLQSAKEQFLNQYDESTGTRLEYNGVVFSARYRGQKTIRLNARQQGR